MKLVLDTNVLLVSISPRSDYHWIFQSFIAEDFQLCVTTDILAEYEEIIEQHMGHEVADTILQIIENAVNVELVTRYYKWNLISEDPDDNKFVDCAVASNATFIVTHDRHFNVLKKVDFPKVEVIDVAQLKVELKK